MIRLCDDTEYTPVSGGGGGGGGVVGWCDGPGETSSAGASYNLGESIARAYCACSRCGWGVVWTFFLSSILFSLSLSLSLSLSRRRPDID